jgi:hypothetical protein
MKSKFYHLSTKFGIALSFLCAIHCMTMPLIMIAFPFLNLTFLHNPMIEWGILLSLVVLGVFSLNHYRIKHHDRYLPIIIFAIGVIVCVIALINHNHYHFSLMMTGSIIIAISQILNITLKRVVPIAD